MARVDSRPIRQSSNAILSFSSFCITSLCLAFVIWKSSKCFSKFFNKPQVTTVSVQKAANFPFPAITICSVFGDLGEYQKFDTSYLEDVCGFRYYKFPFQCTSNFTCKDKKWFLVSLIILPSEWKIPFEFYLPNNQGRQTSHWHQCHGTGSFFGLEVSKYINLRI